MAELRLENKRLIPHDLRASNMLETTSGGLAYVEVSRFGLFLLAGMFIHFRRILNIYRTHAMDAASAGVRDLISPAAVAAVAEAQIRASSAYHVTILLREVTAAPILLLPEPLVSETVLTLPAERSRWTDPSIAATHEIYMDVVLRLFSTLNVRVCQQPEATLASGVFTKAGFSAGAVRILKNRTYKPGEDVYHMNGDYGAAALGNCRLEAAPG